jgi:hypothetical protein
MNKYIVFSAMGFELVGIILGCLYLGKLVDDTYGWKGMGIVSFSILGLTGWLIHVVQLSKRMDKIKDEEGS